jgi:lipopolysaccharide export LptBFGC system permease protein LptF
MIIYRYILREFFASFMFITVILTTIMFGVSAVTTAQQSPELGVEFVLMNSWPLFVIVLPYTLLAGLVIGATISYGRLASDNEIDAIRVTGIYARQVLRPAILLGFALTALCLQLNLNSVPDAYDQQRLNKKAITIWLLKHPPVGPKDMSLYDTKFSYLEARDGTFTQLTLIKIDPQNQQARTKVFAPEATIDFKGDAPVLIMPLATISDYDDKGRKTTEVTVRDYKVPLEVDPYKNYNPRPRYRDWATLAEAYYTGFPLETVWKEASLRLWKSLLPIPLAMLGAGLGVLVRRSSKMAGLGLSIPPLALTYILITICEGVSTSNLFLTTLISGAPTILATLAAIVVRFKIKV